MYITILTLLSSFALSFAATNCFPGASGIKSPAPNAVLTLGQAFNVTFCSGAYFKTSTIDIDIVAYTCSGGSDSCTKFTSGEEVVHALKPVDSYGYQKNVTLTAIDGSPRSGQWAIGVLDHTTGYYTAGSISSYFVPVTFKAADA